MVTDNVHYSKMNCLKGNKKLDLQSTGRKGDKIQQHIEKASDINLFSKINFISVADSCCLDGNLLADSQLGRAFVLSNNILIIMICLKQFLAKKNIFF